MPTALIPSLRQLRYLVELHETRHFGRAAAAFGVGQSTLSTGIAELEKLFELRLVERTQRSVCFTDVGAAFVRRARGVIKATLALTDFATATASQLTGTFNLGIIPTITPFLLPRALGRLRAAFPQLELHVREMTSQHACADLHRGALDAVVLALPYDCGKVEHFNIIQDPLLLAAPQRDVPPSLDPKTLLLFEDGHCLNDHVLIARGLPRAHTAAMVATSLYTLVKFLAAGLGTTLLPKMAIDAGLIDDRPVDVMPLSAWAGREVVLACRGDDMRAFARTIQDSLFRDQDL